MEAMPLIKKSRRMGIGFNGLGSITMGKALHP